MFVEVDKKTILNLGNVFHIIGDAKGLEKEYAILFVGSNIQYYKEYDNKAKRDEAFSDLKSLIGVS